MKRLWRTTMVLSAACLALTVVWQLMWQIGFGLPGVFDFGLHQQRYESIVQSAKDLRVAPGETLRLTIEGHPIWISRDERGSYLITITTVDLDHGGSFGYTWSDTILSTIPDRVYPSEETLPGSTGDLMFVNRRINPHWWSVYNDLD